MSSHCYTLLRRKLGKYAYSIKLAMQYMQIDACKTVIQELYCVSILLIQSFVSVPFNDKDATYDKIKGFLAIL